MKRRWAALASVLALSVAISEPAAAQGSPPQTTKAVSPLLANYPNPFNPETTIPFLVGLSGDPPTCSNPSARHRVSLRIYNVLTQVVAVPILKGGGENAGRAVENVQLSCGRHEVFWDGKDKRGREVASGPYLVVLNIDGKEWVMHITVRK